MADHLKSARTSYDRPADTFYFDFSKKKPWRYEEDSEGLVWRFDTHGKPVGVTVQAYARLWAARRQALAARIAAPLHLDPGAVARRLPA
ncbi:MAG: DUF2283 domain-containing protein [Phenylobacterium sp.]|uniref:DUF2283 domain-containing protein n=1 Tax=Phenylobacterium sp. TaxID=1871053 RepID=UPI001A29765B|nr:DUF2283 domain-containing protein [Phenylobacterium sp.]MBJ7410828.1 DUF2283 domain-containing protein [Phenylobacterium sp.]